MPARRSNIQRTATSKANSKTVTMTHKECWLAWIGRKPRGRRIRRQQPSTSIPCNQLHRHCRQTLRPASKLRQEHRAKSARSSSSAKQHHCSSNSTELPQHQPLPPQQNLRIETLQQIVFLMLIVWLHFYHQLITNLPQHSNSSKQYPNWAAIE